MSSTLLEEGQPNSKIQTSPMSLPMIFEITKIVDETGDQERRKAFYQLRELTEFLYQVGQPVLIFYHPGKGWTLEIQNEEVH